MNGVDRQTFIASEVANGRDVIRAADTKASMLLALAGGGMALAATVVSARPPTLVAVPLVAAFGLVSAALWLLLAVVRPRTGSQFGPPAYAEATSAEDAVGMVDIAPDWHAGAELLWAGREAVRRHRLLQRAVDCLRAALLLAGAAGLVAGVIAVF